MNMKTILLPALLGTATLLAALPLTAATAVANYAEAQSKRLINDDGYIIFAYADGWDKYSKKRCQKLMAAEAIRKAAGNAVLMPWPVPEYTTDELRTAMNARRGELSIPGSHSYPALILLDGKGKHYATLAGSTIIRGSEAEIAELITDRRTKSKKRAALLAKAEATSGPEKAKLTFDAYQLAGLTGFGKGFGGHIAKLDPEDKTGAKRAANYDHYGLLGKLGKMPPKEAVAEVDKLLQDSAYTNLQKQKMCVALLGVLRRNGNPDTTADMRRIAEAMKAYAPDSPEGHTADRILREWIKELSHEGGWFPACLPSDNTPQELKGKLPISAPGTYTVRFDYTRGNQALTVLAVELYDGKTRVAEDRHTGTSGYNKHKHVYTLTVGKKVSDPHLFITFSMAKNRDSYGNIVIEKQ